MPKSHKPLLQQRHNQAPSQHCPKKEMNLFQQHSLLFASARGHVKMPPNVSVGDKDPVNLCKNINSLTLNPPLPEENWSQENTKGPESSLFAHYEDKVRPCIDLIDSLRALGVEQDLALPAIAVIGDQSSGKSSVLEALSGVALPRGSGITTRCPLELKLKKQLSCEAPWSGKISYRDTELQIQAPLQVEKEIHRAQNIIAGNGVGISHELISLEITSPEVPDLTLIDLPGIARVAVGNQPQDIGAQIKALIRKYIQRQQTINLVVVPCNVDIATTEALSMAQEVDPDGDRTIGEEEPSFRRTGRERGVLAYVRF